MKVNDFKIKELATTYYSNNPPIGKYVREPEAREWAITVEGKFTRKLNYEEVKGFTELYHSLGYFREPTGWKGLLGYDLVIDVDVEENDPKNLGIALQDTLNIAERMTNFIGKEPDLINFSGSKGYHVRWYHENVQEFFDFTRNELKKAVTNEDVVTSLNKLLSMVLGDLSENVDLNIYQVNRLIRCPLTINAKTGLPAIPLPDDLVSDPPEDPVKAWEEVKQAILDYPPYQEALEQTGFEPKL